MEINMKILMINGSPRANGNTATALAEMEKVFKKNGFETEIVQVGGRVIRGCIACNHCISTGVCVYDDIVNELAKKLEVSDGLVIGSPVYYSSANGTLISLLDRLFYCTPYDKAMKVGAAVAVARRGGCSATFDELNKYFAIAGMPIATSYYWNSVHGGRPGEALEDEEGLQTMRSLAENMTFLVNSIALGREKYGLPEIEKKKFTNFIRKIKAD